MKLLLPGIFAIALLATALSTATFGQVSVNNDGTDPAPSAMLDIKSTDKGLLVPRVSLTGTGDIVTVPSPDISLLVYNTATTGDVTPGYYYYNGSVWSKLATDGSLPAGWSLTGNAGTNPAVNFLGTTDNQPLIFKQNGVQAGRIDDNRLIVGSYAGVSNTGQNNTFLGPSAGRLNTSGGDNTFVGSSSGFWTTTGESNSFFGEGSGTNLTTGSLNTFIGQSAARSTSSGSENTWVGQGSGQNASGSFNSFLGRQSGAQNGGNYNTFIGYQSAFNVSAGSDNTFVGKHSGINIGSSSQNTLLGANTDLPNSGLFNATAIGYRAKVESSNSMVLGSVNGINGATASVRVGIGTTTPQEQLHVVGNIRMVDGNQAAGKVMVSDGNGTASWGDYSPSVTNAWGLNGNAGTDPLLNFVGTTDANPLVFKVNNNPSGYISSQNTFLGMFSGFSNSTGTDNTFIGFGAGRNNSAGSNNTFIGNAAGVSNTLGSKNIAIGDSALASNNIYTNNIAIGYNAGKSVKDHSNNMYIGFGAGEFNNGQSNIYVGSQAGYSDTTGYNNSFFGNGAGFGNYSGYENSFFGQAAGLQNQHGYGNSYFGMYSGSDIDSGNENTFLGAYSGTGSTASNNNSSQNVAIGYGAMSLSYQANEVVAIGVRAGQSVNISSSLSTFIGYEAGMANTSGFSNTFMGNRAGSANTTADYNSYFGTSAGNNNTAGSKNTYVGAYSGASVNNSTGNSFFGAFAGQNNSGSFNTVVGSSAGNNVTGHDNVIIGADAKGSSFDGTALSENVIIGSYAGSGGSTDQGNTLIGFRVKADGSIATSNISLLGYKAIADGDLTNATAIGAQAQVSQSNSLVLGSINGVNSATIYTNVGIGTTTPDTQLEVEKDSETGIRITTDSNDDLFLDFKRTATDFRIKSSGGILYFSSSADDFATVTDLIRISSTFFRPDADDVMGLGSSSNRWTSVFAVNGTIQTSDAKLKKNINSLNYGLDAVMQLKPVSFQWNDENIDKGREHIGFLAQDLQKVLPEVVVDHEWKEIPDTDQKEWVSTENLGVNYAEITPVLVKAIQEQQQIIEDLKTQNAELLESNQEILKRIERLENK